MELVTCRYIDFPGVGVMDLEVPQFPEKVLEVATERMFVKPSIMVLTVNFRQPSHEFTFGVVMSFISYPLVLIPLV
jgi:hypothetical protein